MDASPCCMQGGESKDEAPPVFLSSAHLAPCWSENASQENHLSGAGLPVPSIETFWGLTDPPGGVQMWEGKAASPRESWFPPRNRVLGWTGSYFGGHVSAQRNKAKAGTLSPRGTDSISAKWVGLLWAVSLPG